MNESIAHGYLKDADPIGFENVKNEEFLRTSITKFWERYGGKTYEGLLPKLAIFAANVKEATDVVRPVVEKVLSELGISLSTVLVNTGDPSVTKDEDIKNFNNLDVIGTEGSKKQFIILVEKGREGWNCRSLLGIALFRSPKSKVFVLQATMRCLRQLTKEQLKATIFLSKENYDTLDDELRKNYNMEISDFGKSPNTNKKVYININHKEVHRMLLNEIINEVGMTKRAVKYYEEKGLLSVDKDNNGYRNYTAQDVETLKKISVYRKLGISIKDIQSLLETGDKSILLRIYQEKVQEKVLKDSELEALKQFIDDGDADKANEALDYQTVENAIESLLPGKEWGDYFKSHFKPFLNVRLKTLEQKQALHNILEYCDETTLKVPFIMGIGAKMIGGIAQETRTADEMIAYYRDMSESEYERLKEKVWKGAKMKNGIMKYHPAFIAQRKMQKELQNKGYNDIFIPNLMVLSPTYAEYKKALDNVNDRMCRELGLYYDSNYNLVIKKDNSK